MSPWTARPRIWKWIHGRQQREYVRSECFKVGFVWVLNSPQQVLSRSNLPEGVHQVDGVDQLAKVWIPSIVLGNGWARYNGMQGMLRPRLIESRFENPVGRSEEVSSSHTGVHSSKWISSGSRAAKNQCDIMLKTALKQLKDAAGYQAESTLKLKARWFWIREAWTKISQNRST